MNRRGFIASIVAALAARFAPIAARFAPRPFIPAARNTILTPSMITREALMLLDKSLTFTRAQKLMNYQQSALAETIAASPKIGATINLRTPPRFEHVDVSFSSGELTLSLRDFSERVLAPQIRELEDRAEARADLLRHQNPNLF